MCEFPHQLMGAEGPAVEEGLRWGQRVGQALRLTATTAGSWSLGQEASSVTCCCPFIAGGNINGK